MSDHAEGLMVLDGSRLRGDSDPSLLGRFGSIVTVAQVIELAESKASSCLFGISLPEILKRSALSRIGASEADALSGAELDQPQASEFYVKYISALADELDDDPILISLLNGSTIRTYLQDEDDFAMLAENLFTELDVEDKGKISKKEVQTALDHLGIDNGVPPASEFPLLSDILKKYGAEGEEKVGQAQFAQILQPVLQELADNLSKKPIVIIDSVKVCNGARIRQVLNDDKELANLTEKIWQSPHEGSDGQGSVKSILVYLQKFGKELGFPPLDGENSASVYDSVSDEAAKGVMGKDEFKELVKRILEKYAKELDANPAFYEPED